MMQMRRAAVVAVAAVAIAVLAAGPAAAHVTVNPREAAKGGFAELTFRVPNERDDASTTKLEVAFPEDTPIASASVRPLAGWTVAVQKAKLAQPVKTDDGEITEGIGRITWSGGKIEPGQYENFSISAGPLPENADQIVFKALQTYSNGEVVSWIEEPTAGGAEPEHPAPVLKLTAPAGDEHAATDTASGGDAQAAAPVDAAAKADVDNATRLGIIGLSVGIVGLIVAIIALVAGRRRGGPSGIG
jgi:periplasmic copper chaperone A